MASRRLLVATRNPGKLRELQRLLDLEEVRLVSLADMKIDHDAIEDGATFEENAIKKAREYANVSGLVTLADDSGLCIDALAGAPGVLSARYAGTQVDDQANNEKLLRALVSVPPSQRTARFVCVIAVSTPTGLILTARGTCEGTIAEAPRGDQGFGYDPIFVVKSTGRTAAELTAFEKDARSHRADAIRKVREPLRMYFEEAESAWGDES